MFEGIRTYENGIKETAEFNDYFAMIEWLAQDPEAGVAAYEDGDAVPQTLLADDIQDYVG